MGDIPWVARVQHWLRRKLQERCSSCPGETLHSWTSLTVHAHTHTHTQTYTRSVIHAHAHTHTQTPYLAYSRSHSVCMLVGSLSLSCVHSLTLFFSHSPSHFSSLPIQSPNTSLSQPASLLLPLSLSFFLSPLLSLTLFKAQVRLSLFYP